MNTLNIPIDYDAVRARIEQDMAGHTPTEWARKLRLRVNVVTNIHGAAAKQRPSMLYIATVAKTMGKPLEWYLYGEAPDPLREAEALLAGPPDPIDPELRDQIIRILQSDHASELRIAVKTIYDAVILKKQREEDRRIERLEKRLDEILARLTPNGDQKIMKNSS